MGSHRDEAQRIFDLASRDPARAYEIVERQLSVLVMRTQVMLSLSGIVITVTGFSGRAIAETSASARVLISAGILVVLLSAGVAIGGVLRLKWLTQSLGDDISTTLERMLAERDAKARFLNASLWIFIAGFTCYCLAIAQMLLAAVPPR